MPITPEEQKEFARRILRRILSSNAVQRMRSMVDEFEREETTDKKLLRILLIMLPILLIIAAALFIWFRHSVSIQPL
jgi:high-affinity K+ transport system ATPase subunit B